MQYKFLRFFSVYLLFSFFTIVYSNTEDTVKLDPNCVNLISHDNSIVGKVCSQISKEDMLIEYSVTNGWGLDKINYWIGHDSTKLPHKRNGNLDFKKFPYKFNKLKNIKNYKFSVPLSNLNIRKENCKNIKLSVVAHAKVKKKRKKGSSRNVFGEGEILKSDKRNIFQIILSFFRNIFRRNKPKKSKWAMMYNLEIICNNIKNKAKNYLENDSFSKLDTSATLLGIDKNNNGIRDDVEKHIKESYKEPKIVLQFARSFNRMFKSDINNQDEIRENEYKKAEAIYCLIVQAESNKNISVTDVVDDIRVITLNTDERFEKYIEYEKSLHGMVFDTPDRDTIKCE